MHFDKRAIGDYCIYAVASPTAKGGYLAGVAVCRSRGDELPDRSFVSGALAGGFEFGDANAALNYAMDIGDRTVREQSSSTTAA